jgi:hypothetical protein
MIKNSLKTYVYSTKNRYNEFNESLIDFFTLFKITSNLIVKRNMTSKICYLLINNSIENVNQDFYNLLDSYQKNNDKFFNFILLILKQKNKFVFEYLNIEDNEDFDIYDFILDE